jgi:photosystem II stability/assembly factor-like uncharacterized protein
VGEQGVILHTVDAGQTWSRQGQATVPEVGLQGVYASDADHAWATGEYYEDCGLIVHTSDGGQTWEIQKYTGKSPLDKLGSIHGLDSDNAWAVGTATIIHTTDGGAHWQDQTPDVLNLGRDVNGVFALDNSHLWVVADFSGIYFSDNGGGDWNSQTSPVGNFYLMRVSPIDSQSAWISGPTGGGGGGLGLILRTTDGGQNWFEQQAPTDDYWTGLAFVPTWTYYFPIIGH